MESNISLVAIDILLSGEYSNLTINCKDHQFKVHRVIFCSQSTFFDAAISGGFQVSIIIISYHIM